MTKGLEELENNHSRRSASVVPVAASVFAVFAAVALAAVACAGQQGDVVTGDTRRVVEELPDWLVDVSPGPGTSMASVSVVEVVHRVRGPRRGVRLVIDGVDVTANAQLGPGRLQYNPSDGTLAPLDSGLHTIVVKRVRRHDFGERPEITGRFEWTVTVR